MDCVVLTAINEKGGTGKTSVSTALAAGLAMKGYRVVLIDADAQANATIAFGLEKSPALYDLVVRGAQWRDTLRLVPAERYAVPDDATSVTGQLMLVPGNLETRSIPMSITDSAAMLKRIQQLRQVVDFIIIDTAPTPSLFHAMIYLATDAILYPSRMEAWSLDGLKESLAHRDTFNPVRREKGLSDIEVIGIVPTMYLKKTLEHQENLAAVQKAFGSLVWEPLVNRTLWAEAATAKRSIFSLAPTSPAAKEAWGMVERVEKALVHER